MMDQPTQDQISKLPKWAQGYIKDLSWEREEANKMLATSVDRQTVTPFYAEHMRTFQQQDTERFFKTYFDAGHAMNVEHEGVHLRVTLPMGVQGREGIELTYSAQGRALTGAVSLQPTSYQSLRLCLPKDMGT